MDTGLGNTEILFLVSFLLLCCCCLIALAGGGAGVYFYTRRNKPQSAPPEASPSAQTVIARPSSAEPTAVRAAPVAPSSFPGPASPIEPDDIRSHLLALNAPEKPYSVQATGYKIVLVPTTGAGYVEVSFDYAEKSARFVELGSGLDPALKQDARQALEAAGWVVKE
jgi:hypothetical protein